jgi:hypothetical protein
MKVKANKKQQNFTKIEVFELVIARNFVIFHETLLYVIQLLNISVKVQKIYANYCQNDLENSSNTGCLFASFCLSIEKWTKVG